ncbi:MAG: TolC family protein [Lentisphaerae bacterium]|nr:TolC family protein [Lentisphaerota bacterium]
MAFFDSCKQYFVLAKHCTKCIYSVEKKVFIVKRNFVKKLPLFTILITAGTLSGCLNYQRPPLAVDQESYTKLQENEKYMLPAELKTLTLQQAQDLALKNNPDFLSIKFSIDSARARYYQQFSNYAPTLNAGISMGQSFSKVYASKSSSEPRSQRDSISPTLSGQWLIFDSLNREMNLLSAKHTLKQTEADVNDARRLLLRAVAYAYNDVQLAYAQKEIIKAQIDYSSTMLKDAERKYKAGTALKSDMLNFRVSLRNSQLDLVKINYTIKANLYVLAGYLGLTDGTIPESIKFPAISMPAGEYTASLDIYLDQALANRPDLKAARERLQSLRYSFYGSLSKFGPTATFNYQLGYGYDRGISHDKSGDGHSWSSTGNFNYSLNVSWNLFNGFSDYFNVKSAKAEVSAADYMLYQLWLSVITDVRTAYENHKSSIIQAKIAREICDLTRETRQLVENEYNAGTALVTRLNEAERDLVQAQNNLASAIVNIANTKAQLDTAIYSFTPTEEENSENKQ